MKIILLLLTLLASIPATDVPTWVLAGILKQESRSYYDNGIIIYVDKATGANGELSAFQIKRIAFDQVKRDGEVFEDLATDQIFAQRIACRYLIWLYEHSAKKSWPHAIQYYNAGPGRLRYSYYAKIIKHAKKAGYATPKI